MPVILTWNNSGGGSSSGGSSSDFANASTLNKLSETADGKLTFSGKIVGGTATALEVAYYVTLNAGQKTFELPDDCDTSQAIVLSLNGVVMNQDTFWEVIEKDYPEKDLIAWSGLGLEKIAQEGDSIFITYHRKG